ncbi:MAG: 2-amino-4-hydroxy-6-hydroxymethyldihydropteridine diphosphokinase [Chloroflexi bacterium]|nr:2-amino-4-hydroxy-6-hydroxymethyldihydropteridine diphosphokinase [Chloroflexota bacterium]
MNGGGWATAYLGLGANLGDRAVTLAAVARRLAAEPFLRVVRASSLVESAPVGVLEQPWFLNQVLEVQTSLTPRELLALAKTAEQELGRRPSPRWTSRAIDVDILLFGDLAVRESDLVVPHPEMWRRRFVLEPLAELRPDLHAPDGRPIATVAAALAPEQPLRPAPAAPLLD